MKIDGQNIFLIIPLLLVLGFAGYYGYYNYFAPPQVVFLHNGDVEQFVTRIEKLEEKLKNNPDDNDIKITLAQSYMVMARYDDAVNMYGKAWAVVEKNPEHLANFAKAILTFKGGYNEQIDKLLEKSLAIDPNHIESLILAGGSARKKNELSQTKLLWERALAAPKISDEDKAWLTEQLNNLESSSH